jgi:hypothetical protein
VYVDTSVFGGVEDEEFQDASTRFFEQVKQGRYLIVMSTFVLDELADAPAAVRRVLAEAPPESVLTVPREAETEARELARAYITAGVVGPAREGDALHVATASVVGAQMVLSWNFRHLVNYDRIRGFNGVNALNGYPPVEIHSPLEVVYGDDAEDEDV